MNETGRYRFKITCKSKMFGTRTCEMRLETGELLTYMPVPYGVRFDFSSIMECGDIGADCLKWACDNYPTYDCNHCQFIKGFIEKTGNQKIPKKQKGGYSGVPKR